MTPTAWLTRRLPHALMLSASLSVAPAFGADNYPSHPITLVAPFAAGGGADVAARLIASRLPAHLGGQTVIVDNKPGASGNIGAAQVARARPPRSRHRPQLPVLGGGEARGGQPSRGRARRAAARLDLTAGCAR